MLLNSAFVSLSVIDVELLVIPFFTGFACGLTLSNKAKKEKFMNKVQKNYEKAQQIIIFLISFLKIVYKRI